MSAARISTNQKRRPTTRSWANVSPAALATSVATTCEAVIAQLSPTPAAVG